MTGDRFLIKCGQRCTNMQSFLHNKTSSVHLKLSERTNSRHLQLTDTKKPVHIIQCPLCPAAACLCAVPAGPQPVSGHATGQSVCGRVLLYIQPARLLQPAGQPAQEHPRAQHCNLELRVSAHAIKLFHRLYPQQ